MFGLVPYRRNRESYLPAVFDRFFDEPLTRVFEGFPLRDRTWAPAVEISESEEGIQLHLEVPGLEQKDLQITLESGVLSISGERSCEKGEQSGSLHSERWYGRFMRSFRLPESAAADQVAASLKNGILTITVPKKAEAKPKQIEVKIS